MLAIEMLSKVPLEVRSKFANTVDYEDPSSCAYHQQSVHKLACLLKIVHNVLDPCISERPDLPFPKFSK
jgi:hypothetical protein